MTFSDFPSCTSTISFSGAEMLSLRNPVLLQHTLTASFPKRPWWQNLLLVTELLFMSCWLCSVLSLCPTWAPVLKGPARWSLLSSPALYHLLGHEQKGITCWIAALVFLPLLLLENCNFIPTGRFWCLNSELNKELNVVLCFCWFFYSRSLAWETRSFVLPWHCWWITHSDKLRN